MTSKLDVYAPCPCGSGKKVKFCCSTALTELDRVMRLHDRQQPEQALKTLDQIQKSFPDAPIVAITRGQLLMEMGRFDEAALLMREFLKAHPDNGHGTALLAFARFMDVGFQEAKPEIHRAFQVCQQTSPDTIASLAAEIAAAVIDESWMAGREHLALSLRLTQDNEERQNLIRELMRVDGSASVPFPLRGVHSLEAVEGTDETRKDLRMAARLSAIGCWEIAGKLFQKVADQLPDQWGLWKNIGLCRAWDTDRTGAADALHKAASLCPTYEDAVECETLAQLLDMNDEDSEPIPGARFRLKSISKAVSLLDDHPQLVRRRIETTSTGVPRKVAEYSVLDRPLDNEVIDPDHAAVLTGVLVVAEVGSEGASFGALTLAAVEPSALPVGIQLIESRLADELDDPAELAGPDGQAAAGQRYVTFEFERMLRELRTRGYRKLYGTKKEMPHLRAESTEHGRRFLRDTWVNVPLRRLGGKSAREAAGDPALRVKLAAAVHVLETVTDLNDLGDDVAALRQSLNIDPEKSFELSEHEPINALSVMKTHRLQLDRLTDDQLAHFVNRALLVSHAPFSYAVLVELQRRGKTDLIGPGGMTWVRTMVSVCRQLGRRDEALQALAQGVEAAERRNSFEEALTALMLEFSVRVEDKADPELPRIIDRLWNHYGGKLPELREQLGTMLDRMELPRPGRTASGLVLPGQETVGAGTGSGSKLWIPE